jgi:CheY-like chemotaxis protein
MTSRARSASDRVRALAAGFDQHQLKPLDQPILTTLLSVAAERARPTDREST